MVSKYLIKFYIRGWFVGILKGWHEESKSWNMVVTTWNKQEQLRSVKLATRHQNDQNQSSQRLISKDYYQQSYPFEDTVRSHPQHYIPKLVLHNKTKLRFFQEKKTSHLLFDKKNYVLCSLKALIIR